MILSMEISARQRRKSLLTLKQSLFESLMTSEDYVQDVLENDNYNRSDTALRQAVTSMWEIRRGRRTVG